MEKKDQVLQARLMERIKVWQQSQEGQTSGYEYEHSFSEMMRHLGQDILQASTGEEANARKKKK
ncbi:hypothetical protein [Tunicatimonas pelagia]|uniref:hypothetical protein n=1 Tax=Tunicatimonas pelagia TaxID=931531 RepID=UPI002665818A|nr:hypothetical protein [Tunicatimonas pelagia]WKN40714.1 hypothetical protein P0M28_16875 [Tunicatimonas pelagia]WKN43800.1 hypothetical protein P0M28_02295 [Tunicatimonas pelagia]WKN44720.1 hypothetical protein P0M28_07050 [Tunicatimonas pelagia]